MLGNSECVLFLMKIQTTSVRTRCYTCMFPAISPLDCLKFPQECPVGQRCIASKAVGVKGSVSIVLYERSCALPLQCDLSGEKHAAGINFNYTSECCDTDLCNTAAPITNLLYF
uniref:UPAR/Ly6 domain-containing protein n=1 Tax=Sinocyclocheilus rhinocerous TaxID=307959 RepID=A0A673KJV9_9TELE